MAAPYNPPVKNEEFYIHIALQDLANNGSFKAAPTIVKGDFKVCIWDGNNTGIDLEDITTLPQNDPNGSVLLLLHLTAAEMNGDVITVIGIDQSPTKEWADFMLSIPTTSA